MLNEVKTNFFKKEEKLSPYACPSSSFLRERLEIEDIRPPFFHDSDRIIHALSYTRYLNKTQVFSYQENDHVSKRIVHVQLVSKVARTIARALSLNEDLTEAIALGHDIGHAPLGHFGESVLNEIAKSELGEVYAHNLQSVRTYQLLENRGSGVNLTIQVLDGILCHNGELLERRYEPCYEKTMDTFLSDLEKCYKDPLFMRKLRPMTLEGCVVRISDVIAYIGRDIEDAIAISRLSLYDIPLTVREVLGRNNREIVNTLILDIIEHSLGKPYIEMSEKVFQALLELLDFNYQHIYLCSMEKEKQEEYRKGFWKLYYRYLDDLKHKNKDSILYTVYLDTMDPSYQEKTDPRRIVIDFLGGFTDRYFLEQIRK